MKKGGGLVTDQLLVQIDTPFHVIVRGGPEAGGVGGRRLPLGETLGALIAHTEKLLEFHGK
jgi:hypothetical protein